jgi:hypothetical protein
MKLPLVDQEGINPTRKTTAAAIAGATLTICLWAFEEFYGVTVDTGTQGAFHTLIAFAVAWMVRDRMNV